MSSLPDAEVYGAHYVYRCYDAQDRLLYIGCAQNVGHRLFHLLHPSNRGKQPNSYLRRFMVRHEATQYPTKLEAREAERQGIAAERPLLNKQHNPAALSADEWERLWDAQDAGLSYFDLIEGRAA